ncbi:unnamed protein product [Auanema sp. JU1783]|nr:unnamed protein product [Auanema sp. JU1783]
MATIFSLSSGSLPAAIAVFRISGQRSLAVLQEITNKQSWTPKQLSYTKIYTKNGDILDTAMAVHMPGPSTFTGEDSTEIYVHGSQAVANALADRLVLIDGVRQAKRGEFTKRAFFNGKMNMSEVNGLKMLINSETERQRQVSYRQMRGGDAVQNIRKKLADVTMRIYVLMDFGEHVDTSIIEIHNLIANLIPEVNSLCERTKSAFRVQRGLIAVLVGPPNSGKSSIMNALAQDDIAIVSPTAGTTRDVLQTKIQVNGIPVTLTDTAGLRETGDDIELEGIRRARNKIREADIVLLVSTTDSSIEEAKAVLATVKECEVNDQVPIYLVRNKSDLAQRQEACSLPEVKSVIDTCALSKEGVSPLLEALENEISEICPDENGPALTDHHLIQEILDILLDAQSCTDAAILCVRLEECLSLLGQITGDTVTEEILDKLFETFCIGK